VPTNNLIEMNHLQPQPELLRRLTVRTTVLKRFLLRAFRFVYRLPLVYPQTLHGFTDPG
jgi:hypothetical protein